MSEQSQSWLSDRVAGVILAGGRNSRMGGLDKAFLKVGESTVFERILVTLRACFPQVVVVSNTPEKYAAYEVEVTSDELRGLGPLGGLHAGLGRVRTPFAFVAACDMPFLRPEPIRFLVARLGRQEAIVPCWNGDIEPLHALYAAALRPRIAAAVQDGARALRDFLPRVDAEYVPESVMRQVSGADESFRNVNTPEEAARYCVELGG
jgi:molybdopterin-guanine dinucleotide biosynthesis protein A